MGKRGVTARRCGMAGVFVVCLLGAGTPTTALDSASPADAVFTIPDPSLRWRSIAEGESEAAQAGKPVLYFFTADWCPPCETMKRTVFADQAVIDLIEREFVPVEVVDRQVEEGANTPEVEELKERFLVFGLPTLVVNRPGSAPAVTEEGNPGTKRSVAFLRTASQRLADLEHDAERGRREREAHESR